MSTALALVNRMRAKRRDASSNLITDRQGVAYLDILNAAVTTVLEQRTWDFQKRSDGQIITVPSFSGTSGLVTQGAVAFFLSVYSGSISQLVGSLVTRVIFNDDTAYGHTAMRVDNADLSGGAVTGSLEEAWPGTVPSSTWTTYTYEYILPSTVREVLSIKTMENDEPLAFSNSPEEFDEAFPRPWDDLSSWPSIAVVGGEVKNTVLSGAQGQDFGLALRVWPVPDAAYQLDYTYVYRQPRLVSDTDTLSRIPPAVEDLIVDLAVARVVSEIEKDLQTGIPLEAKIMQQMEKLHRNHVPAAGKRPEMLSHDKGSRSRNSLLWLPRQVDGIPTS